MTDEYLMGWTACREAAAKAATDWLKNHSGYASAAERIRSLQPPGEGKTEEGA